MHRRASLGLRVRVPGRLLAQGCGFWRTNRPIDQSTISLSVYETGTRTAVTNRFMRAPGRAPHCPRTAATRLARPGARRQGGGQMRSVTSDGS